MRERNLVELLQEQIVPLHEQEVAKAVKVDALLSGENLVVPHGGNRDKRTLKELSHTGLLDLIVEYSAQQIVVEGITAAKDDVSRMWIPFEWNGIPSRQGALWRAVLSYGQAYGLTLPGSAKIGNPAGREIVRDAAYMRAFTPKQAGALYADPADDDFPLWAWWKIPQPRGTALWNLVDDEKLYTLSYEDGRYRLLDTQIHEMGVTPFVRLTADADLGGRVTGQPLKYRTEAQRHDKTVADRLRIQHYNSWRVKYAIKMADTWTEEQRKQFKLKLENDDILIGDGDTEFGTLEETSMASMNESQETDRDTLAAVSQTPVWAFNGGSMANLSADALVEAKSGNRQKVWMIQREVNRAMCSWARLAARAEKREDDAWRFDLTMTWADIGSQSMAAAADSLGKLAVQLGVPVQKLWELIPGVSQRTVESWREYAESHPSDDLLLAQELSRQMMPNDLA